MIEQKFKCLSCGHIHHAINKKKIAWSICRCCMGKMKQVYEKEVDDWRKI